MKLLIATEFFHDAPGGGPAVIRQMLKGFVQEDESKNSLYWWGVRRSLATQNTLSICASYAPPFFGKLYPARKLTQLKAVLLERVWAPVAAAHLQTVIRNVQPDGIWVIPHNWSVPPMTRALSKSTNKVNFHTTLQDYTDTLNNCRVWGKRVSQRMAQQQSALYRFAASRDATSFPMLENLKAQTGAVGSQMLHQGLEKEDFTFLEKPSAGTRQSKILRIAYAGTIIVMDEFRFFIDILTSLRAKMPLELHFFGAHSYVQQTWFRPSWMVEHGNLPERKLVEELRGCDWGFSPMAFEDDDPRYNRYSFPTKFITYLAAGLPIITLGHPECSVMRMARSWKVGINILDRDARKACTELQVLANQTAREEYRKEILRCARENFDADAMRNTLWQCFYQLAARKF